MKIPSRILLALFLILSACVTIPKETVILSETLGNDLQVLHTTHRNTVEIYYNKVLHDINSFIDDVYAPYIIHYVLKDELEKYQKGDSSLFKTIETAAKIKGKIEAENALNEMIDFQSAARIQIDSKRDELLSPIKVQESEILAKIDKSYENAVFANSTITGYLKSIRKVKDTQQEALSLIGLPGADTVVTNSLVRLSTLINKAIDEGKKIDVKSEDAYNQLESISNKIKELTDKK